MTDDLAQLSPRRWESRKNIPWYFNKAGLPIYDVLEWSTLFENHEYQQILSTLVHGGGQPETGGVRIQTIWDGHDPDMFLFPKRKPHIFHTAVWGGVKWPVDGEPFSLTIVEEHGWPTLEEAWKGHFELVVEWERRIPDSCTVMDWRHHPKIAAM